MPRYKFSCEEHGHFFAFSNITDRDQPKNCPSCGSESTRVFCAPSMVFVPARWAYDKAGIREVTGGYSMNDIRHDPTLRKQFLT